MKKAILIILLVFISGEEIPHLQLGQSVRIGGIEFTPLSVELRQVTVKKPGWPAPVVGKSENKYTVLTFKMVNATDVQVINPGDVKGKMEDQFRNVHRMIKGADICAKCALMEPANPVELLPGDSQNLVAIFEAPKIKKAQLFTIQLRFAKDNQGEIGTVLILFERAHIKK